MSYKKLKASMYKSYFYPSYYSISLDYIKFFIFIIIIMFLFYNLIYIFEILPNFEKTINLISK